MRELPRGTVTLVFTDIEGSTRLLHELGDEYAHVLAEHRRVLRDSFGRHGGVEVDTQGDAFFYVFARADDAIAAAAQAQDALQDGPVRVRIGVHTGEPLVTDDGYVGIDVHRAARVMSAGHGGQVLVSERTQAELDGDAALTDLGLHRLKDLGQPEKLFQLGAQDFAPLKTLDATNLPVAASPLLGRQQELDELVPLLQDGTRLLTITGPGGTGKTRLALQIAAELVGSFADGVFWVPLAELGDPELVLPTVAQTLGVAGDLRDHLRAKELLLLLDNVEHLLAAAPAIAGLLAVAPKLRLLVTSRAPLRVAGERDFALDPLDPNHAVTLFVERARATGRDLVADDTVAAICLRLDGLPLAIELAAARTKFFGPETLLRRLESALPLLTTGRRDAPDRQRTLEATIAWSYRLLDERAQQLFACLSVFVGSFSLDSSERVCSADFDTVGVLADLSLLKPIGEDRFLMLETIREYAHARARERVQLAGLRDRHADHYLGLASRIAREVPEGDTREPFERLSAELPNVRAALANAARSAPERALRVAVELAEFWNVRAMTEGLRTIEGLYRAEVDNALRVAALGALSSFAMQAENWDAAERYAGERLELAREIDDRKAVAGALALLATCARRSGDVEEATRLHEDALRIVRTLGDSALVGQLLWERGFAEQQFGDPRAAVALFEEALAMHQLVGDTHGVAWAQLAIGCTYCRSGEWHEGAARLTEALEFFRHTAETKPVLNSLDHLAAVAATTGEAALAARIRGACDAAWKSMDVPLELAYRPECVEHAQESARSELGDSAYRQECARGSSMSLDEAVAEALAIHSCR